MWLELDETAGQCRLSLGGHAHGYGQTMQEAADDLVARVQRLAKAFRNAGIRPAPGAPTIDPAWLDFLWDLGERAERGEDVREYVLGFQEDQAA